MRAKNIMTTNVLTVGPNATVKETALLLAEKGISAVPVVDRDEVVGIVTEGDLVHRQELGSGEYRRRRSWYHIVDEEEAAAAFRAKAHGMRAHDVMTRNVITISGQASMSEIADVLEGNNIKQLLVMSGPKLAGIITRADIVRALAARPEAAGTPLSSDDDEIRMKVIEVLEGIPGTSPWLTTVIVLNGVVNLYGTVEDEAARDPSRIAVEKVPYVVRVEDHRAVLQPYSS
ncbi:MAG: CBS domain-containing protein [Hyphomicrobiales bacterium]|nr:CBS domain-containing protein [Hyphomicrobiales bacterium]